MARVSIYLNFPRSTEDAFNFYKSVFGTEFVSPIVRFKDIPSSPGQPPMAERTRTWSCMWNYPSWEDKC